MMKVGRFTDYYRGNGLHFSAGALTFAVRLRWYFYWTKVPAKPGYVRFYFGPFEIEYRATSQYKGVKYD